MKYTKEMYDAGELPKIGMKFVCDDKIDSSKFKDFLGKEVTVLSITRDFPRHAILFTRPTVGIGCGYFDKCWVKPIDTRTDRERAIDDLNYVLMNEVAGKTTKQIAEHIIDKCIGQEFEYLAFAGDEQ